MWEYIKNNPLLKTIAIVILGVLGFGFAFNIMFGSNVGEMGNEMSGGYSLDNTLAYILAILIKILLITIVITAIVMVVKYLRKHSGISNQNGNSGNISLIDYIKADPILKAVTTVIAGTLLIGILSVVFNSVFGFGRSYTMSQSYNYGFALTGAVLFLIRFLMAISVVGLVIGTIALLIQNRNKLNYNMSRYFNYGQEINKKCGNCGDNIKADWLCCPKCGQDIGQKLHDEQEN